MRRQVVAHALKRFDQGHEEGCGGANAGDAQFHDELRLLFGAAGSAGDERCSGSGNARIQQKAGWHKMVGPCVENAVTRADACLTECMRKTVASVVVEQLGFVDGAR